MESIASELRGLGKTLESHSDLALCATAAVGVGLLIATRGRILGRAARLGEQATASLPELEVAAGTAGKTLGVLPELEVAAGTAGKTLGALSESIGSVAKTSALRSQTLGEIATEKVARMSFSTADRVLKMLGKAGEGETPVAASDDLRRTVFNRFLSRLDQEKYVLHGSYPLESQQYIMRKAVKDLDLLSVDQSLIKPTRQATNQALVQDLRAMVGKPAADGLHFEIPELPGEGIGTRFMYPRMRHGTAIAKAADGSEIMRIPLDIRIGAGTILRPTTLSLSDSARLAANGETLVSTMQAEETFAHKLFSYTNRTIGGLNRKPKDLSDMAGMINKGLDEQKVAEALQAWTRNGYSLGPIRHPGDILGSVLDRNMFGQTTAQLDANFGIVKNYFQRLAPQVESAPLFPHVSLSPAARLSRFMEKQFVVYPAG